MKNPFLQTTRKWQNKQEETHTYLLYVISCCPVQKQNHQSCHLIHHSIFPCNQKNPKPMSYDSLPAQSSANFSDVICNFSNQVFLNFKTIYSGTIWSSTLCLDRVIEKKLKALPLSSINF